MTSDTDKTKILVCLQHTLSDEQKKELTGLFNMTEISLLSDVNPDLFNRLANSPDDAKEMGVLASEFADELADWDGVLLPIGSPAVMFRMAVKIGQYISDPAKVFPYFIFAHTDRVSEDIVQPDGSIKKVSVFKHKHFSIF